MKTRPINYPPAPVENEKAKEYLRQIQKRFSTPEGVYFKLHEIEGGWQIVCVYDEKDEWFFNLVVGNLPNGLEDEEVVLKGENPRFSIIPMTERLIRDFADLAAAKKIYALYDESVGGVVAMITPAFPTDIIK